MAHVHISYALAWKSIAAVATISFLYAQPYRPVAIIGKSMEPTYRDRTIEWAVPIKADELHHGDVVVIKNERGTIIKRVAMLPGDKFWEVKSGGLWLDMKNLRPQVKRKTSKNIYRECTVPDNCIYVLGDNGQVSMDSRSFGYVSFDQIESRLLDQRANESLTATD